MKQWRWQYSSSNEGFFIWYGEAEQKASDPIIEDWFRTYEVAEKVCDLLNQFEDLKVPYPTKW